jgi:hypothetical protein
MRSASLLATVVSLTACSSTATPVRPNAVPSEAVWAGGVDGGAWILCVPSFKEPHLGYACTVYNDSGSIWAKGSFIVAERRNGNDEFPSGAFLPPTIARYQWFDGRRIQISESRSLRPSGVVDFPFGNGHGKRIQFSDEGESAAEY